MTVKAILFDYGNTLVSTRLDWERILPANLAGLYKALMQHFATLDMDRLGRDFMFIRQVGKQRAEEEYIETAATDSLSKALESQGIRGATRQILQEGVDGFFEAEEQAYPIIFGIPEALAELKKMKLKLAVVSNATCAQLVRRALKRRGQLAQFDQVVISAEVGPCKPDPAIFWGAMNALEVAQNDCVVVGDQLNTDIKGANQAGMRSVLTNFFNDPVEIKSGDPKPDAIVKQPSELSKLFKSW